MKVALVHDYLYTYAGAERVLQAFHQLYPEAPIYTAFADPKLVRKHFPKATFITPPVSIGWSRRIPGLVWMLMPKVVELFDLKGYDLVLSSSGAFSHGVLTHPGTTHLCYCHSPMRWVWDWHREFLAERGIRQGLPLYFTEMVLSRLRLWDTLSASRVDHWIANSQTVSERISKYYRQLSQVIHPPVDTTFFDCQAIEWREQPAYALSVSRLDRTKRLDIAIGACAAVGLPLWIAGQGKDEGFLRAEAERLGADVRFLGPISENQKRQLLAEARCFIFPTEEDFGIAPVEALAMGTPVIALGRGGATETVQDGKNGRFFRELSVASLRETLDTFLSEGVQLDRAGIRKTSLPFSTERFVQEIQKAVTECRSVKQ